MFAHLDDLLLKFAIWQYHRLPAVVASQFWQSCGCLFTKCAARAVAACALPAAAGRDRASRFGRAAVLSCIPCMIVHPSCGCPFTKGVPRVQSLRARFQLPLGAIVHPLAGPQDDVPVIQLGPAGIVRCKRCRTYINPFMMWQDGGRCGTGTCIDPKH